MIHLLLLILTYPFSIFTRLHYRWLASAGRRSPNQWIRRSADIGGWLLDGDHEFLWELACRPADGHILEVGSWMGKSTCILAGACIETHPGTRVYCVDPFEMREADLQDFYHRYLIHRGPPGTFYQFAENARRFGFSDAVVPVAAKSGQAIPFLPVRFRMAFIDAGHTYDRVKEDTELALPLIVKGGVLALHDAAGPTAWPGVARFVKEDLMPREDLRHIGTRGAVEAFEILS